MSDNSAFISYRRDHGFAWARLVWEGLRDRSVDAFLDLESMRSAGRFDHRLLNQIAARPYFVPILTVGSLDRCVDPEDWVRREIEHAISTGRIIVPAFIAPFEPSSFPSTLPAHIDRELSSANGVTFFTQYLSEALDLLANERLRPITLPATASLSDDDARFQTTVEEQVASFPAPIVPSTPPPDHTPYYVERPRVDPPSGPGPPVDPPLVDPPSVARPPVDRPPAGPYGQVHSAAPPGAGDQVPPALQGLASLSNRDRRPSRAPLLVIAVSALVVVGSAAVWWASTRGEQTAEPPVVEPDEPAATIEDTGPSDGTEPPDDTEAPETTEDDTPTTTVVEAEGWSRSMLPTKASGGSDIVVHHAGTPGGTPILVVGGLNHGLTAGADVAERLLALDVPDGVEMWVVPRLVPDGDGRRNARGVDVNRNFAWGWESGDDLESSDTYHGPFPESEPETRAIIDLAAQIRPVWVLSLLGPVRAESVGLGDDTGLARYDILETFESLGPLSFNASAGNCNDTPTKACAGTMTQYMKDVYGTAFTALFRDSDDAALLPEAIMRTAATIAAD